MKLTIQDISKQYKDKWAISHFSAELSNGVYGLLGPNGAGKTTLMRMLADILQPTAGNILLDGEDIRTMGDGYRDLLGYLPQHCGFYKQFTAHRFLMYIASLKGQEKKYALAKVDEMLHLVGLADHANRKIKSFSGGMRRRLGIAQALLNDPKVLILDEPTAGLDPKERIRFRNILSELSGDRIVLLSTHIVSDIEYVAKEVLLMNEGQLLKQDRLVTLLEQLKGMVWKAMIDESQLSSLKRHYKVGNILRQPSGIEVRILSKEQPLPSAHTETPGLEDLYLYYFNEELAE
ncbi:ABC transporter ATP-binding protein [Paenibacillus sp. MER TA 81-3]|uniref:ABC transporter ATP-binding protein n=1 Tax=Paenibacillus sp. MER TA 81-3 TaxID=2939573 RepID=UPI00203D7B84|nr:ABC transporter ATP-binding protein [Paenibacillus sp. MER TA 81-3]MCM3342843.1 ABC transporter ATP-binding protein [Paenibacillus sp. MER TA 81-3]